MARIEVEKFVFVGVQEQKDRFFEKAQEFGIIHFINISGKTPGHLPEAVQDITNAIKVIRGLPITEQKEPTNYAFAHELSKKVLSVKHEIESHEEELRVLNLEISRIEEFGEFSLLDIAYIEKEGNRKIQFFCAKKGRFDDEELPDNMIRISTSHGLDYFVTINKTPQYYDKMVEMHFEYSLSELREKIKEHRKSISKLEEELKQQAKYKTFLHHALILTLNDTSLSVHLNYTHDELGGSLFAVEGWVPDDKVGDLKQLTEEMGVYYEQVAVEEDDHIPTHLENRGVAKIGEDLVHIYDTPSPTDRDPSLWVLGAFALFFAMIVNDAGYGFVYLAIVLYVWYIVKKPTKVGKRVLNLSFILCGSCIIWGFLTASFFGIKLETNSPLRKVSILQWISEKKVEYHYQYKDKVYENWVQRYPNLTTIRNGKDFFQKTEMQKDNGELANEVLAGLEDGILLEIALVVGIIHIILSFARYLDKHWGGIGWIIFLIGAYLYFPHYLGQTSLLHYLFGVPPDFGATEGLQLMFIGIGVAIVLSIIQHRLGGLAEGMNIIQVFADVLSYLRLYALGLASGIVAQTINALAGAMPVLIAIVLMAAAHTVNMLLGIMSGVIHGLRLNYLEWYHYSFEGGGKLFDPLRLYEIE